ncbi:MAG TPA: hypothetical protein DEF32_16420 [Hydrogenophaga sp.]|nr:hypothetical protein [Hydrogenophaga sp.]
MGGVFRDECPTFLILHTETDSTFNIDDASFSARFQLAIYFAIRILGFLELVLTTLWFLKLIFECEDQLFEFGGELGSLLFVKGWSTGLCSKKLLPESSLCSRVRCRTIEPLFKFAK